MHNYFSINKFNGSVACQSSIKKLNGKYKWEREKKKKTKFAKNPC